MSTRRRIAAIVLAIAATLGFGAAAAATTGATVTAAVPATHYYG